MLVENPVAQRQLKLVRLVCDLAVTGGGLAGTCCAITAARAGLKVTLIHDRPVLGGNSSSEVRLWVLGATSHMGNNNRWAREGGVVDELLLENQYRNPEGNPLIWDTILLEKVAAEPNITLLLNTAVHDLEKSGADTIKCVRAFCPQNSTAYEVSAPLFTDASGDGIVGFLAGAAFRIGAEAAAEFGEKFAPATANGELLGHSLYFYSKDTGRPVRFTAPSFALRDITQVPRYRDFNASEHGCRLWWIEYGGLRDTVHDTELIKWELWKVAYGVWDYIKNSGRFPEAANLTLEWVGMIPGKRESRRFEGDYMLVQQDLVEQRLHADAVSAGGWAIDLHPAEGVYSEKPGCQQWHVKGIYQIPYRCLYSRNISNLFLAGRVISASHIAFGSTRVMATCAHSAQAVAIAAAICRRDGVGPRDVLAPPRMAELQERLIRTGQFIPDVPLRAPGDLATCAHFTASSVLRLDDLPPGDDRQQLTEAWANMLPVSPGEAPVVEYIVDVDRDTELVAELRTSSKASNHTPDRIHATLRLPLKAGTGQRVGLRFDASFNRNCYAFYCLMANQAVTVHLSEYRVTGVLAVCQKYNRAVAKTARQDPPADSGIESFEFWLPQRRPGGKNLACRITPALLACEPASLANGFTRPTSQPNAWVADFDDFTPAVTMEWAAPVTLTRIELSFDTDFDHPLETVLLQNPETVSPFCALGVQAFDNCGRLLGEVRDNHLSVVVLELAQPASLRFLRLLVTPRAKGVPAALFRVSCFDTRVAAV